MTASSPSPVHMWGFVDAKPGRWTLKWCASHSDLKSSESKDPPRRAQIISLWKPQLDSLFRSPWRPETPSSLTQVHMAILSYLYHIWGHLPAADTTETLTCRPCLVICWLHESHCLESSLILLCSWHRLCMPCVSPEWSSCLHSLKEHCITRQ